MILKVLISVPSILISIGPDDQPFRMGIVAFSRTISLFFFGGGVHIGGPYLYLFRHCGKYK